MTKESDNSSENVRKARGDLYDTKKSLVTTIDTVVKEGTTDMVDKNRNTQTNVVEEAITPPISEKKKIDTGNKIEKSKASNKTVDAPKSNKSGFLNQ